MVLAARSVQGFPAEMRPLCRDQDWKDDAQIGPIEYACTDFRDSGYGSGTVFMTRALGNRMFLPRFEILPNGAAGVLENELQVAEIVIRPQSRGDPQ
jgi:hypothetical protein